MIGKSNIGLLALVGSTQLQMSSKGNSERPLYTSLQYWKLNVTLQIIPVIRAMKDRFARITPHEAPEGLCR